MGDDMERRMAMIEAKVAVAEAIMPRVEHKMDCHIAETKSARQVTNDKLDALIAKENQNKGVSWAFDKAQNLIMFAGSVGILKWIGWIK